jgi:hypothetical protein
MYYIFFCFLFISTSYFSFPQQSSLSKSVNYLSDFIASEYFNKLKPNNSDLVLVDTIYLRSINYFNQNLSEALLSLTFATIPYKEVPIQIPLFNWTIDFPLVSSSDSIFNLKNKNLPKNILFDSPQTEYGDKDKLAHFFGNAFIGYHSDIFDLGNVIGYFVEAFEEDFKVQSSVDERDLIVNNLGNIFGKAVNRNAKILPSSVLIMFSLVHFRYHL